MKYVIDASTAVEFLLRTPTGQNLEPLLDEAVLFAPCLMDAEVLAVLRKLCARSALGLDRAAQALEDLRDWPVERLDHRTLLEHAWRLREHVTAYDALYVAAASLQGATLLTADGPLSRARALGIPVHHVRLG